MGHSRGDLIALISGLVLAVMPLLINFEAAPLRLALLSPLVLWLPGHAVLTATPSLWPGGRWERTALSIGFSLVIAILVGLALNLTHWGLGRNSEAYGLLSVTLIPTAVALLRVSQTRRPEISWPAPRGIMRHGLVLALAAVVLASAVQLAYSAASEQPTSGFTQLWVTPEETTRADILTIGIRSMELRILEYTLLVEIDGNRVVGPEQVLLAPGEARHIPVPLLSESCTDKSLTAELSLSADLRHQYRRVSLRIPGGCE